MKKWLNKFKQWEMTRANRQKPPHAKADKKENTFAQATSWADDVLTNVIASRNRYKVAFYSATGLAVLMLLCIMILVPTQHTELVVVHSGQSGYTWLSMTKVHQQVPATWKRTQAEIAHYVVARESYDPLLYRHQTREVDALSTAELQGQYALAQSSDNKASPINLLGAKGYRTVVVHNVLLQDLASRNHKGVGHHINLAQVNYVIIDHLFGQSRTISTGYTAIVSWRYDGIPSSPDKQLSDWDGFTMVRFTSAPNNSGN